MDGAVLTGALTRITLGRSPTNDLSLAADRSVSSKHAVLSLDQATQQWAIEDTRSTNGTWVDGSRVNGVQPLSLGTEFIIGYAVVRCTAATCESRFTPDVETLRKEGTRLIGRFSPETAQGFGAALMLAGQEKRSYVSDRQFLLGLAAMNPSLASLGDGSSQVNAKFLTATLRRNDYWTGDKAWIGRHLRAVAMDEEVFFSHEFLLTPRLVRLLLSADEAARQRGSDLLRPLDVLRAMLSTPGTRPRDLLERGGVDPAIILAATDAMVAGPSEQAEAAPAQVEAPATPLRDSVMLPVPVSSGDPVVDGKAQEAARELTGIAALYHLAEASERHTTLKRALSQHTGKLPADQRQAFLEHLRRLFPIQALSLADLSELARLRSAPEKAGPPPVTPTPAKTPIPSPGEPSWRLAIRGGPEEELATLAAAERNGILFFNCVLTFASAVERFIVATAHNLTTRGSVTEEFYIPGYRTSLRKLGDQLLTGRIPAMDEVKAYLTAVERWLVALTAAYHESPGAWFEGFWKRVSPSAIETAQEEVGRKKVFRIEALELWNAYKEAVRAITPELVTDEILLLTGRRAQEQFEKLRERKGNQ